MFLLLELTKAKFLFVWGHGAKHTFMYISINANLVNLSNDLHIEFASPRNKNTALIAYQLLTVLMFYSKLQNNQLLILHFLSKVFRNIDTSKGIKEKKHSAIYPIAF